MRALLLAALAALGTAACRAPTVRKTDLAAEAAAVRALDSTLNAAIQRRDTDAVVAAYAPGGALLWQNDPRTRRRRCEPPLRTSTPGPRDLLVADLVTQDPLLRLHTVREVIRRERGRTRARTEAPYGSRPQVRA